MGIKLVFHKPNIYSFKIYSWRIKWRKKYVPVKKVRRKWGGITNIPPQFGMGTKIETKSVEKYSTYVRMYWCIKKIN